MSPATEVEPPAESKSFIPSVTFKHDEDAASTEGRDAVHWVQNPAPVSHDPGNEQACRLGLISGGGTPSQARQQPVGHSRGFPVPASGISRIRSCEHQHRPRFMTKISR